VAAAKACNFAYAMCRIAYKMVSRRQKRVALLYVRNLVSLKQAGRFAERAVQGAEVRTFAQVLRRAPAQPICVYLTHPNYGHVRSLLKNLKPSTPDVVIYYASDLDPAEAAQLGLLIGEMRPKHTTLAFDVQGVMSVLRAPHHDSRDQFPTRSMGHARRLRERFGLTQTEMAQVLGVSLRTVQNWERDGERIHTRRFRDLEELWDILREAMSSEHIPVWLKSANETFGDRRPIDLMIDGKARDVIVEFRRLQAGEPV
jgi:DNA-binding XRE family transcriptional regulator